MDKPTVMTREISSDDWEVDDNGNLVYYSRVDGEVNDSTRGNKEIKSYISKGNEKRSFATRKFRKNILRVADFEVHAFDKLMGSNIIIEHDGDSELIAIYSPEEAIEVVKSRVSTVTG